MYSEMNLKCMLYYIWNLKNPIINFFCVLSCDAHIFEKKDSYLTITILMDYLYVQYMNNHNPNRYIAYTYPTYYTCCIERHKIIWYFFQNVTVSFISSKLYYIHIIKELCRIYSIYFNLYDLYISRMCNSIYRTETILWSI